MKQAHICLDETLGVRYAILPGDPARLDRVAAQLESVRELAYNREFRSLTGTYKGVPVLAVSTGIGGSSAGICVEELHNIGVEAAIRIGSCGALQKGIALGDLILGCGAIRDDGASKAYVHPEYPAVADYQLLGLCVEAAKALGCPYHVGIIHSHESFYHEENDAESAYWSRKGALGADMESAALFTIGRLRGMKTASILNNVVVYGEDTANAIGGYVNGESRSKPFTGWNRSGRDENRSVCRLLHPARSVEHEKAGRGVFVRAAVRLRCDAAGSDGGGYFLLQGQLF